MSDPIPGYDPNAAYDVVPSQDWLQGWTVTCNGIPVRHFVNKTNAERYCDRRGVPRRPDRYKIFVDIAPGIQQRSKLATVRQRDRFVERARLTLS
jgi:hypothetical protein